MFTFDFITPNGFEHFTANTHYMIKEDVALKFVGWDDLGNTEWMILGPLTANFIKRDMHIQEIEAGLHD